MQPTRFDELTKTLASATSRRQVLKTIATASIGSLVGLAGIRSLFGAASGSNKDCAKWCAQVFGPNTSAAGKCTSDAAKGRGVCITCGNVAPSSICCARNNSGYCNGSVVVGCSCNTSQCQTCNTTNGTCGGCPAGQICLNDQCAPCITAGNICNTNTNCCSNLCCPDQNGQNGICCASGQVCLSNGTCASNCDACVGPCGCYVGRDPHLCGTLAAGSCSADTDCPRGQWCDFDSHECFANC